MAGVRSMNEWNCNNRTARKSLLQSGSCQVGVSGCQVGLLAAPLPRARAAEGGPHNHNVRKHAKMYALSMATPPQAGAPLCSLNFIPEPPGGFERGLLHPRPSRWDSHVWYLARLDGRTRRAR